MNEILLASLVALLMAVLAAVLWLLYEHRKLRRRLLELEHKVSRNSEDIAGICSAAVAVDSRVQGADEQLKAMAAKIAAYDDGNATRDQQAELPPYQVAIDKIHQGASAEELVRECGLSRDEADLLIRLHAR
ncbi:DUF2802 domain-containing protein [Methylomarinum sp. Ch1-1]|uniref:DUF2802 domain-containing protein n=1 Tax=Methylomarinum roseum TaxID=3067653 RepID=A0AAU7NU53_9GAMM|nr:DUF2802 domain-containing protein [Methylomarinum sp. Ch1-1]MDP4519385.1 DUF2802 domain-containing protein [Methylomarinum sp. Ch1-1]